jgi:hypothetical protein
MSSQLALPAQWERLSYTGGAHKSTSNNTVSIDDIIAPGVQQEALQQLQTAHAEQEAHLLAARAEAAAVPRLRKQLANQSQVRSI